MKAYLFIETGEVRQPRHGECFMNMMGNCIQHGDSDEDRVILTRHEIEIPNDAIDLIVEPWGQKGCISLMCYSASIPRPKKKVKKCQYVTINSDNLGRKRAEVTGWLTEKEALARGLEPEDRVYQTEIEVEE